MLKYPLMNKRIAEPVKNRNPYTLRRHRKEVFWQIALPMILGMVVLLILTLLTTQLSFGEASFWASISEIWLILPLMLVGFVTLATLVGGIYLSQKIIRVLPFYSFQLHKHLLNARTYITRMTDRSVEPALRLSTLNAAVKTAKRQISRK